MMKHKYVLLGLELAAITLSIIFPEVVPFIIAGILIIIFSVLRPVIIPVLLIVLLGFNEILPSIDLGSFSINPSQVVILLAIFYLILNNVYGSDNKIKKYNNFFFYLLVAFFFFCIVSVLQASDKIESFRYIRDLFYYILLAIVIVYWINNLKDFRRILNIIKITGLIVAILGIIQLIFRIDYAFFVEESWWGVPESGLIFRIKSTFRDPNFLSNFLLLPFFIALAEFLTKKKSKDFLTSLIILGIIILTNSRGGFLALFIGLILFSGLFYFKKGARVKYAITVTIVVGIVILTVLNMPKEFIQRSIEADNKADWSSIFRVYYIFVGFKIIMANMFWGIGINNFPLVLKNYTPDVIWESLRAAGKGKLAGGGYAHNTFITIWAETGIFNALILLIMFFSAFYILYKVRKNPSVEPKTKLLIYAVAVGFICICIQILTITYISYHTFLAFLLMMPIYNFLKQDKFKLRSNE